MSSQIKSLIFAAALCIACSVLLTGANTGLKPLQQRNMAVDRHRNILLALGACPRGRGRAQRQDRVLVRHLCQEHPSGPGTVRSLTPGEAREDRLPLYVYVKQEQIEAYVVPINTRGLWGEINGYLAIENDGATIRGFTVYKHTETPGLGGEIESRWFRKNFENKKIVNAQGSFASIGIAKGAVSDVIPEPKRDNYVDGISGATLTGKYLSAGLEDILQDYEPVAIEFRQKNLRYLRVQ
jgi:Na+-transporting NADH:ubiquinone oxidoreductase subunit C